MRKINKFKIGIMGLPRILYYITLSLTMSPMRFYEAINYNKKINEIKIDKDPIFILGH